jgi:hypothetical protein
MPAIFMVIMHRFFLCWNPTSEQLSEAGGGKSRQNERERENFTEFRFCLTSHTWSAAAEGPSNPVTRTATSESFEEVK